MVEIKMRTLYREFGVCLLLIFLLEIHAEETWRVQSYNCGQKSVDIDQAGVVYLKYSGAKVTECVYEFLSDDFSPNTCFKITKFSNVQCGQSVKIVHYGTTARTFDCHSSSWGEEYCDVYSKMKVIFDSDISSSYSGEITMKVYSKDDSEIVQGMFTSVIAIIGIVVGVIAGGICLIITIICCCCNRRSHSGQVVRNQQQSTTTTGATTYPLTSPAAYQHGYQAGYQPPPQGGYPVQQTGYPQAPAGYPTQPAGYPPQQTGYPPQPAGYPPQPAGYPVAGYPSQPPGYPSQAHGHSQPDEPEKHKLMASAPPQEDVQMGDMPPPPPYPGI